MYLGGCLVNATECNYNTAKDLGLVCPYCNEPIFFRSGTTRVTKLQNGETKKQIISPNFAHYKSDSFQSFDCENRAYTKKGKQRLKQIEIEGKNQRLELYNHHLWLLFLHNNGIKQEDLTFIRKFLGFRFIESCANKTRQQWERDFFAIYKNMENKIAEMLNYSGQDTSDAKDKVYQAESTYFNYGCNLRLHKKIIKEIGVFLKNKTSNYFWIKLASYHATLAYYLLKDKSKKTLKKIMLTNFLLERVSDSIACTHWIDAINEQLSKKTA